MMEHPDQKEILNYAQQLALSVATQITEKNIDPIVSAHAMASVFKGCCISMGLDYDEFLDLCLMLAMDYKDDLKLLGQENE